MNINTHWPDVTKSKQTMHCMTCNLYKRWGDVKRSRNFGRDRVTYQYSMCSMNSSTSSKWVMYGIAFYIRLSCWFYLVKTQVEMDGVAPIVCLLSNFSELNILNMCIGISVQYLQKWTICFLYFQWLHKLYRCVQLLYCACISTIIYTCLSVLIYVGGQISYQKYLIKRPAYDVTPLVYTFTLNGWLDEWGLITCLNSLLSININPNKSLIRTKHTQNITIHLVIVYI